MRNSRRMAGVSRTISMVAPSASSPPKMSQAVAAGFEVLARFMAISFQAVRWPAVVFVLEFNKSGKTFSVTRLRRFMILPPVVRLHPGRKKSGAPAGAAIRGPCRDHPPAPGRNESFLQRPAQWLQWRRCVQRVRCPLYRPALLVGCAHDDRS